MTLLFNLLCQYTNYIGHIHPFYNSQLSVYFHSRICKRVGPSSKLKINFIKFIFHHAPSRCYIAVREECYTLGLELVASPYFWEFWFSFIPGVTRRPFRVYKRRKLELNRNGLLPSELMMPLSNNFLRMLSLGPIYKHSLFNIFQNIDSPVT